MKLPKKDLWQLANLELVNHGMYPQGRDFERFIKNQAKKDFEGSKVGKLKRKHVKESEAFPERIHGHTHRTKKKNSSLAPIIGWVYDKETLEVVIQRYNAQDHRMYEFHDMKMLCDEDILELSKHPLRGSQGHEEAEMFIEAHKNLLEEIAQRR